MMIPNHHPINPDGLVLWLDYLNTGSVAATGTWKDYSGLGNHGTLLNDAYVDASGWRGDNTGTAAYIYNAASLQLTSEITMMAWVYATADPGIDGYIFAKRSGSTHDYSMRYDFNLEELEMYWSGAGRSLVATLSQDTWTHFCVTANTTQIKAYKNGTLITTLNGTYASTTSNSVPLWVGSSSLSPAPYYGWIGMLNDLCVYNRVLAAGEIQNKYQRTLRA